MEEEEEEEEEEEKEKEEVEEEGELFPHLIGKGVLVGRENMMDSAPSNIWTLGLSTDGKGTSSIRLATNL